jgi:mercuric reductase
MFFGNKKKQMIEIKIEGMTCDQCASTITQALKQAPGVTKVCHVDWKSGSACVDVEEGADPYVLTRAIEAKGYRAQLASSQAPSTQTENPGSPAATAAPTPVFRSTAQPGSYDLLVLGAGSAGFAAAIRASDLGARVGLVEGGVIGGTCVNVGCVPSKTLIRAAEVQHRALQTAFHGILTRPEKPDWRQVREQKDELVGALRQAKYVDVLKNYPGVEYVEGRAKVLRSGEVELSGGKRLKTGKVIVTTGSRPWAAPIPGLADVPFLDSTSAMALEQLPPRMVVLGASAVGLELAQMFSRLGVKITVIEALPRVVPAEDPEIGDAFGRYLEEEDMTILPGYAVRQVKWSGGLFRVSAEKGADRRDLEAEQLLVATGRKPITEGLGLAEAGIELGPKGHIVTDEYLRTGHPNVYAAGDCAIAAMFVYVSAYSGHLAAENALLGNTRRLDLSVLPKVTFTDPQVASVGLTEAQARERGIEAVSARLPLEHVPRALAARDTRGFIKLVAEKATGKLLGAHILASEAGEIIQVPTLAIKYGIKIEDLTSTFFPYLTQVEGIKLCAQMFSKDVSKLSCCAA